LLKHKRTSAHRPVTLRLPSDVSLRVSSTLKHMVEGQPTSTEPHQDPGDVVGFSTTAGETQRFGGSGGVSTYQRRGDGA